MSDRIMIVDDEAIIASQLEERLLIMGMDVIATASSGEEAVAMARETLPNLILMDIIMPGKLDGIEAALEIKKERDVAVIFISGYTDPPLVNRARLAKPFGYIVKPFQECEIKTSIEIALCQSRLQKRMKTSLHNYEMVFWKFPTKMVLLDEDMRIEKLNAEALKYFNTDEAVALGAFVGPFFRCINALDNPAGCGLGAQCAVCELRKNVLRTFMHKKPVSNIEVRFPVMRQKNRTNKIFSVTTSLVNEENRQKVLLCFDDITAKKRKEREIHKNLREKEIMLKEIYHRVKNNLIMISSLVNLQDPYVHDEYDRLLFKELQKKLESVALVHERLYRSKDQKFVEFGDYTRELVHNIVFSFSRPNENIRVLIDMKKCFFESGKAVPLGLILTELVTNALKYAFGDSSIGEIRISLKRKAETYVLCVSNNGTPFPDTIDIHKTRSLGFQIICALVEQLKGSILLNRTNGALFTITFPRNKKRS